MIWLQQIHLLYLIGFFINFQPANPFTYEFFLDSKKFSTQNVRRNILPFICYSTILQSIFVFVFADLLGLKPFIVSSSAFLIVSNCLKIWTDSIFEIQIAESFTGSAIATELAYYISIYAYYDVTDYERLTSFIRACPLLGQLISSLLAQFLISTKVLNYQDLHYINLTASILALILSIFHLSIRQNEYSPQDSIIIPDKLLPKIYFLKSNFVKSFHHKNMIKWSIWNALTICNYHQVLNFVQPLWKSLQSVKHQNCYNGSVEGIAATLSFFVVLIIGMKKINWKDKSDTILALGSGVQFSVLISMASLTYPIINYGCYVVFIVVHHFIITGISVEIAKISRKGCIGSVFGFIYLIGAVLNSVMTCLVNDEIGFGLEPEEEFFAYALFHMLIFVIFTTIKFKQDVSSIMMRHQNPNI